MTRFAIAAMSLVLALALAACGSGGDDAAASKTAAAPAVLIAPPGDNDKAWKEYLQNIVGRHMDSFTDRVYPYYLPTNSGVPTPGDLDNKSQYDRQLENVKTIVDRTLLPRNLLAFGSPDSVKMADLVVAAFEGAKPEALAGSQVLFIGKPADSERVKAAVEKAGAKFIFVEAK